MYKNMSTISHIDIHNADLSVISQKKENQISEKSDKKPFILIGIIVALALITTIVLLIVILSKKEKKSSKKINIISSKPDNYYQIIELLVDGQEVGKRRNLQEKEKIQILGQNFDELNSINSIIYIDDKNVPFDKFISIESNTIVKVVIKFLEKISTFKEMFSECNKIKQISLINIETDLASDATSMFENCLSLTGVQFENMSMLNITNTSKMFQNCQSLNNIEIEGFSTNKTKDMSKMFKGCSSLNKTYFIENLSTSNAEYLNEMFSGCFSIKSLKLLGYDTSKAKNMSGMFKGMSNLEELELGSFHTEKVENMNDMFESCTSISSLNLSSFDTSMVTSMDRMFANCLSLTNLDVVSFVLTNCISFKNMFTNTTRKLMLEIEKNPELLEKVGYTWSEKDEISNKVKIPLDILFLIDATGSMQSVINKVKNETIYISVYLLEKRGMKKYDLSLGAIFYRDPIDSPEDINEVFDFNENTLDFKNFVNKIKADGGRDIPEDWAGAFNLAKNLTWRKNSTKFIVHIADAPGHGDGWTENDYFHAEEGKKTDEIITYFAKNNFSIAGFQVQNYFINSSISFYRAQELFKNNYNKNYFIQNFSVYEKDPNYFLNLTYNSFQNIFIDDVAIIKGEFPKWAESGAGAHYYAHTSYTTGYSKVAGFVILPDKLETHDYKRNAYISFGVRTYWNSIDTGIRSNGKGWCPYYYNEGNGNYSYFENNCSSKDTSIVGIELEVTLERMILFTVTFRDLNKNILGTFNWQINASEIMYYEENIPIFGFYRFASLVNNSTYDDQNDNTYMLGGKLTELTIVKNGVTNKWGMLSDDIAQAWKISSRRINISYTDNSDIFDIYHRFPEDD